MIRHKVTIPIKPKSKGRPRAGRNGFYTDKATKIYEQAIGKAYIESEGPFFVTPVQVNLTFMKGEVTIEIMEVEGTSSIRSDLDNLIKAVLDGLNGVAFTDDKQVVEIHSYKK